MKKRILLFIAMILFSSTVYNVSAVDYNFAQNEDYYAALCSSSYKRMLLIHHSNVIRQKLVTCNELIFVCVKPYAMAVQTS